MKLTRLIILSTCLLAGSVIYYSCQKSSEDDQPKRGGGIPVENVSVTVTGRVLDEQEQPVEGAVVKAGSSTATTDLNGQFRLTNVTLNKHAGQVKVEKNGYFHGSRTFTVIPNTDNFVSIELIQKTIAGTVSGSSGGNVTVPSGGSIMLDAGGVVNADGITPYTGTVTVSAFYLDPEAANFRDIMPGALRGITTSNEDVGLQSFGMMAVELTGNSGEKLQPANGKPATLTIPIPASLLAQAPVTIPIWSFNDTTGVWKEEGTATKQGTNYVCKTSHFSFWNCDAPFPIIDFKAVIKDQHAQPLDRVKVVVQVAGDNTSTFGYGYTDDGGIVAGKIPANKPLKLIIHNKCGDVLETRDIGPFGANADLGVLTVQSQGMFNVEFSGTVVNCSYDPVTNGYVTIELDGAYHKVLVSNGSFSKTIQRCNNTVVNASVLAYDVAGNQGGSATTVPVTGTAVNVGQLFSCGTSLSQFINFTLNNVEYAMSPSSDTITAANEGNYSYVDAIRPGQSPNRLYYALTFDGNTTGATNITDFWVYANGKTYFYEGPMTVNITEYGAVGGFIAGSFSGNVKDSTSGPRPVSSNFRVMRKK